MAEEFYFKKPPTLGEFYRALRDLAHSGGTRTINAVIAVTDYEVYVDSPLHDPVSRITVDHEQGTVCID